MEILWAMSLLNAITTLGYLYFWIESEMPKINFTKILNLLIKPKQIIQIPLVRIILVSIMFQVKIWVNSDNWSMFTAKQIDNNLMQM